MTASFKFQFIVLAVLTASACSARRRPDELAVIAQIKQLHELATVRYSVQRVVGLREPKVPFGEESILLMVEGRATAGVDLAALSRDNVRFLNNNTAIVALPAARILDVSLDEKQTKVWDRQITWWTPWAPFDPDLEHRARLQAIDDVRRAATQMGILEQAQHNAETAIRDLLGLFDINVDFRKIPS